MRLCTLLILIFAMGIGNAEVPQPDTDFKLYLLRHAEKQVDEGKDPGWTNAGQFRAHQLVKLFQYRGIESIWSTDYKRTRDTVMPLVNTLQSGFKLYDPHDLPEIANQLLKDRKNALIVGHSNTTPDLTRLLCQCDMGDMDESEYDLLFVVSVLGSETKVEILKQSSLWERWVR